MLLSFWFFAVLVAAALAAVAGTIATEVVRYRRGLSGQLAVVGGQAVALRIIAWVGAIGLTVAAVGDGVNRHFSYIPSFAALSGHYSPDVVAHPVTRASGESRGRTELAAGGALLGSNGHLDHGVVEQIQVPGPVSGIAERTTYVYLPPAYFDSSTPDRRFPVLYLIHGSPGISQDWLRGGYVDRTMDQLLKHDSIAPFIVVLPDVNGGYGRDVECEDIPNGPQAQTYLVTDVVSYVDQRYRTVADRSGRAVGGLSTGGYCGINLMLRHPDVYSAAVSHSGYGKPDHNRYTGNLFGGNAALAAANTPDDYAASIPLQLPSALYMDAGASDGESRAESARLYHLLTPRGVQVTYNVVQGESHDFVAWRRNLNLSLPWLSQWFTSQAVSHRSGLVTAPDTSYLPPPSPTDVAPTPHRPRCPVTPLHHPATATLSAAHTVHPAVQASTPTSCTPGTRSPVASARQPAARRTTTRISS
jgi:enterochelin esterase-like enzyme